MSAFVNPEQFDPLDVPCPCPPRDDGQPRHDHDTVMLRSRLHYGDLQAISRAGSILGVWDEQTALLKLMETGIGSWTFVNDDGTAAELSPLMIQRLDPFIAQSIQSELQRRFTEAQDRMKVPNASSGRSQPSSPAITPSSPSRKERRSAMRSTPKSR